MLLIPVITFIIVLAVLVLAHEAGHFFVARKFGVKVDEFGFGLPPRICGIKRRGILYSLNWIPFGGFVKIKGEQGEFKEDKDSFAHKKIWQRSVILSSGVAMNFFLTVVLIILGLSLGFPTDLEGKSITEKYIKDRQIIITYVEEKSSAKEAGLQRGDIISKIGDEKPQSILQVKNYIKSSADNYLALQIKSWGAVKDIKVKPNQQKIIGVVLGEVGIVKYPLYKAIPLGIKETGALTFRIIEAVGILFRDLIIKQTVPQSLGGPVAIAVLTSEASKLGLIFVLQFIALLSLNLAVLNILPIPALDGGRILFLAFEKLRGKAVTEKMEAAIHNVGFVLLIALAIFITFKDLTRFEVLDKLVK